MNFCILGAGAWGTALATVLANNNFEVRLWCREQEVVETIRTTRVNELFLPGILLDEKIIPTNCLNEAVEQAEWIFAAVPVKFFRAVVEQIKPFLKQDQKWVILNKGMEQGTLLLPSQILDEVLGKEVPKVALVGPSFAKDLAQKQLTAVTAASSQNDLSKAIQEFLQNDYFMVDQSEDVVGVQLCAALKNVITLGVGILDGAGYTDNTKAFFLVKSLAEIRQVVVSCGGLSQTVDGFAGIGDLVLTALGKHSRNLAVGKRLGKSESLEAILADSSSVVEGINTTTSVQQLITKKNLELPLFEGIYQVVHKGLPVNEFILSL